MINGPTGKKLNTKMTTMVFGQITSVLEKKKYTLSVLFTLKLGKLVYQ